MTKQASVLLKNVGKMNPTSVSDFVSLGGFSGIKKAITMDKPAIIDEILNANVKGDDLPRTMTS